MKVPKKQTTDQNIQDNQNETELPGYPAYPKSQDVYNKFKEETEIDPENISEKKRAIEISDPDSELELAEEQDFFSNSLGSDLDVPGSELDDDAEDIGNEDEENNFYSLGDTD